MSPYQRHLADLVIGRPGPRTLGTLLWCLGAGLVICLGSVPSSLRSNETPVPSVHTVPIVTDSVCIEDMKCWDWRTMGNRRRGLITNDIPMLYPLSLIPFVIDARDNIIPK